MPNTSTYSTALLDELRRRVKDTSYESPQFDLVISGDLLTDALVEVTESQLITTVTGSGVSSTSVSLDTYSTVEKLVNHLNTLPGYSARLIKDGDPNHTSNDLQTMVPTRVLNEMVQFHTRRWADNELAKFVDLAVNRHNLSLPVDSSLGWKGNYTSGNIPEQHHYFIVLLAHIELLKELVQDGAKRRGTDFSVSDFVSLKTTLEEEYATTLALFLAKSTIPSPQEQRQLESKLGEISVSHQYRETWRHPVGGRFVPAANVPAPTKLSLTAVALGSGKVWLAWSRSPDSSFWKYELWRNTTTSVSNISDFINPSGSIAAQGTKVRTEFNLTKSNWVDSGLTPGTYYYRIYGFSRNNDYTGGDVVEIQVT